ncbi:hypothetical protein N9L68_00155 [bacterium]|nr:hypothetical protein [bacterium]
MLTIMTAMMLMLATTIISEMAHGDDADSRLRDQTIIDADEDDTCDDGYGALALAVPLRGEQIPRSTHIQVRINWYHIFLSVIIRGLKLTSGCVNPCGTMLTTRGQRDTE